MGTQAGAMAYGMWLLSTGIDAYFARQALPDQYTAHNITVTIRTVTLGLTYLATFIFGVNAMGLFGARLQDSHQPAFTVRLIEAALGCYQRDFEAL